MFLAVPRDRIIELLNLPKKRITESVLDLLSKCDEIVEDGNSDAGSDSDDAREDEAGPSVEPLSAARSISSTETLASVDGKYVLKESQDEL